MGYKHTPWVLEASGLTPTEKLVLWCLTMHAKNDTLQTWVKVSTIAEECGYSPSSRTSVRRALQSLRDKGFIDYYGRKRKDSREHDSNMYSVNVGFDPSPDRSDHTAPTSDHTAPRVGPHDSSNGEVNGELNEEVLYTSDSYESDQQEKLARPILTNPTRAAAAAGPERSARAAAADPVSPEFYASEDRQILIESIQNLAQAKVNGASDERLEEHIANFENNLVNAFNEDDLLDHLIGDMHWTPTKIHVDKFEAAKWLNKFLHTWTNEIGQLAWRGQTP